MDKIKLNIQRFENLDAGTITTYTVIDSSGAKSGADETVKSLEVIEKSVDGTSKALASLSLSTATSGKNMRSTSKTLRQDISNAIEVLKKQVSSVNTDDKFKIQASSLIGKVESYEGNRDKRSTNLTTLNKEYSFRERLYNLIVKGSALEEKAYVKEKSLLDSSSNSINKKTSFFKRLTDAIKSNTDATKNNGNSIKKSASSWEQFTSSLTGKLVRFRIISSFFKSIGGSLMEVYDKAASYQEALNLYTVSLGEYAEKGQEWADSISKPLYLDPQQVMQYTGSMYNLVQGLGVASDAAYKMSTNLTQLAYDMSSYLNIDVESAHEKLTSAITGQSRAVVTAGVAMQQASLQELAYSLGIKKKVSTMTQSEKTYLRYIQIMRSTSKMQGDLARTIVTPENALRVMQTQFGLLARAIGNVFIPIVLKAIPYVMAFTQILTELAQKLAHWAGFKIEDIDYSKLKNTTLELDNVGEAADTAGKKINRTLAAFDDLNVVESKSSGAGGGGGVGGNVLDDLKKYVDGYDMLEGLNKQLSQNVESIKAKMKSWIPIIKDVALAFLAWKALKGIASIFNFLHDLGKGTSSLGAFGKALVGVGSKVKDFLLAPLKGLTNVLGGGVSGLAILIGSIVTFITTTKTLKDIVYTWTLAHNDLNGSLVKSAGFVIGLQLALVAALSVVNPFVGIIAALGFAIADVNAVIKGHDKAISELVDRNLYGTLSVSTDEWLNILRSSSDIIIGASEDFDTFKGKMEGLKDSFDEADKNVSLFGYKFRSTTKKISEEDSKNFKDSVNDMCDSTTKMIDENANRSLDLWGNSFSSMSTLTDEEENHILTSIMSYGEDQKKELKDTQKNITDTYDNAIKTRGYLTDEEYNYIQEQLQKIRDLTKGEMTTTQTELEYLKIQGNQNSLKLDKESYKNAKESLEKFSKEQTEQTKKTYNEMLNDAERYRQQNKDDVEGYNNLIKQANATREENTKKTEQTIKDYQSTILSGLAKTYMDVEDKTDETSTKTRETIRTIFSDFKLDDKTLKDTFSKAGADSADSMVFSLKTEGVKDKQTASLQSTGTHLGKAFTGAFEGNIISTATNLWSTFTSTLEYNRNLKEEEKIGKNVAKGIGKGMKDDSTNKSVAKSFGTVLLNAVKGALGIKSPARLFIRNKVGNYITQGIAVGMNNEMPIFDNVTDSMFETISKGVENSSDRLQDIFSVEPVSDLSNTISNEFTTISKDLDLFSNKWSNTMSNMFESDADLFNKKFGDTEFTKNLKGITYDNIDLNTYSYMKDIPEFVSSVVSESKTVDANKDNTLLTNALTNALSSIKTDKESNITQVYIGNDKVYEGQGVYQNRQTDRYGINTIKI